MRKYKIPLYTVMTLGLICAASHLPLEAISLAEKRASLQGFEGGKKENQEQELVHQMNEELIQKREALLKLHVDAFQKYQAAVNQKKSPEEINQLLQQEGMAIQKAKADIATIETNWKTASKEQSQQEDEGLWHQPDTTIGQLVIDYGSSDWVYLMPPEIAAYKLHISSQLSVPRASWSEMMELILQSNGIGTRELNPFMRQLYFMRLNPSGLNAIIDSQEELELFLPTQRICYVLSPPPTELRRIYQFMEKFVPQETMTYQQLANTIVMVGSVKDISELLKIYNFLVTPKQTQEYRLVSLQRAQSEEIAKILQAIFDSDFTKSDTGNEKMPFSAQDTAQGFRVIALKKPSQSLFLWGKHDIVEKACQVIQDIESKIGEVQEKTIYWYGCKNSDAGDLAKVLSQVYSQMIAMNPELLNDAKILNGAAPATDASAGTDTTTPNKNLLDDSDFITPPVVSPSWESNSKKSKKQGGQILENFIVDVKTNSIVMVVESYLLDKLKELACTLDVPKKMVHIDVLLCEKKVSDQSNFGMNLLRVGDAASNEHTNKVTWNGYERNRISDADAKKLGTYEDKPIGGPGILQYAISRHHSHLFGLGGHALPFDLSFNFLLAKNDMQINANPSVTTVNQTPAKISIVEELSISMGLMQVEVTGSTKLQDTFQRAQYGITLTITPTIHAESEGDEPTNSVKNITLTTDISFDNTTPSNNPERPNAIRRNIKNEVRVANGETIILGGLRRKNSASTRNSMPFLGELPFLGKFFSETSLNDEKTEMIIFITPRIVPDSLAEEHEMRRRELEKRPGDIPEFLRQVEIAKRKAHTALFRQSLKALFQPHADAFNGYKRS